MKILVTGSEGSLMQAVIPKLLAQGHEITGVDNLYRYVFYIVFHTALLSKLLLKCVHTTSHHPRSVCQARHQVTLYHPSNTHSRSRHR